MKNEGGWEAGKCSKVVPDVAIDVCLSFYEAVVFSVFPFPVCRAQLIGDWYENRRGAQNMIISLQSANTIGAPMSPVPIVMVDQTRKKIRET